MRMRLPGTIRPAPAHSLSVAPAQAIIAESVDNLGDQFRPAMRTGWLKYIRNAYPDGGAVVAGPAVGEGPLLVPD